MFLLFKVKLILNKKISKIEKCNCLHLDWESTSNIANLVTPIPGAHIMISKNISTLFKNVKNFLSANSQTIFAKIIRISSHCLRKYPPIVTHTHQTSLKQVLQPKNQQICTISSHWSLLNYYRWRSCIF